MNWTSDKGKVNIWAYSTAFIGAGVAWSNERDAITIGVYAPFLSAEITVNKGLARRQGR